MAEQKHTRLETVRSRLLELPQSLTTYGGLSVCHSFLAHGRHLASAAYCYIMPYMILSNFPNCKVRVSFVRCGKLPNDPEQPTGTLIPLFYVAINKAMLMMLCDTVVDGLFTFR